MGRSSSSAQKNRGAFARGVKKSLSERLNRASASLSKQAAKNEKLQLQARQDVAKAKANGDVKAKNKALERLQKSILREGLLARRDDRIRRLDPKLRG